MNDTPRSLFLGDKKPPRYNIRANPQDNSLLDFLWRWQLASTSVLSARFYPERSPRQAYERLRKLERGGLIQCYIVFNGRGYAWGITKRAFTDMVHHLPALQSEGFLSEDKEHDLLVSAIHLGDWLWEQPQGSEVFSEQQLRTYHPEVYPAWIPQSQSHRPDGYWYTGHTADGRTIALEVEFFSGSKRNGLSSGSKKGALHELQKNKIRKLRSFYLSR